MTLIFPMYSMVLLTFFVGTKLFLKRVRAVKQGEVKINYYKVYRDGTPSEGMIAHDRHFVNLFEVPVLFYAVCLAALTLKLETTSLIVLAWLFVLFRILHAYIHLTSNRIRYRMRFFLASFFTVIVMWTILILKTL